MKSQINVSEIQAGDTLANEKKSIIVYRVLGENRVEGFRDNTWYPKLCQYRIQQFTKRIPLQEVSV